MSSSGLLCASTGQAKAPPCPDFLFAEYREAANKGAELLAARILEVKEFESFKYSVAALAGFMGYENFGRFLEPLELYKGQFHHPWFERPMPADEW